MQLQNLLGSKFVGYFLDEILDWQRKLRTADAVINAWFEVQRAWASLESIFIGSEDIRSQLPEETKRFEKIDREFKVRTFVKSFLSFLKTEISNIQVFIFILFLNCRISNTVYLPYTYYT